MALTKTTFGITKDEAPVSLYRLTNSSGAYVELLDYGCRIHSICVPNKEGVLTDVTLGYETLAEYEADTVFLGAAVGRHANRIGAGKFMLNGIPCQLETNNGPNHLHGGSKGFSFRIWGASYEGDEVAFSRLFPDGEDGYPGNLSMKIRYDWTDDCRLLITYEAVSDKDTIINFTNHVYFNLEGFHSCSALDHELQIFASSFTENDDTSLPTGVIIPVEGTPFDFREFKAVGRDIGVDNVHLKRGNGYDHNYVLDGAGFRRVAVLKSSKTGIRVTCSTDQPGMQLYTGNFLASMPGKKGQKIACRGGICLETQHFPNATNIPVFPSVVLKAGEQFVTKTEYGFDAFG